ncbi:DsbA family protein [Geomicrobium sp. JSM 1781026]|uniref:DsbA family protein n=1 Tax=Geomicrobium sp. JSM 1781026 TaxID=3344580 RepID=UPI0035BFD1EA
MAKNKKRKNTKTNKAPMKFLVIVTALLVVVMAALLFVVNSDGGSNSASTHEDRPPIDDLATYGNDDPAVSIVEFGDYKCPACGTWDREVFDQLESDYLDHEDISFSFVNFIGFQNESLIASLASQKIYHEASEDQFWDFHHALMQAAGVQGSQVDIDFVVDIASEHAPDVDEDELRTSITEQEYMDELYAEHELIEEFGVERTPTIFVNDVEVSDPFDYNEIERIIEEQLEENS